MSILLVDRLGVCLAVWVEQFLAAFLPRSFISGVERPNPVHAGDSA